MILRALGAELVLTDPLEGTDGAIREARRLNAAEPDQYFYPDQYSNDGNWRAHYDTTGPEIIEQTSGRLTHFVAGLGTSGTFIGTGRRLRQVQPGHPVDFVSAERTVSRPRRAEAHGVGHGAGASTIRRSPTRICGSSSERAYEMVRRLAREEGLLVGISSGAALAAIAAGRAGGSSGACVVTVFPDGAEKYLTEKFWEADA